MKQHRFMARGADACGGMGNYSESQKEPRPLTCAPAFPTIR